LSDFDDRDSSQNVARIATLITGAAPALYQAFPFVEVNGRHGDAAARRNLARGQRPIVFLSGDP